MSFVPIGGTTSQPTSGFTPIDASPVPVAPVAQAQAQGFISKITTPFVDAYHSAVSAFQNTPETPKTFTPISSTVSAFSSSIKQGVSNLETQFGTIMDNHSSLLQKGAALGEAGVGTVNALFGALLSPLQGLATIPKVGGGPTLVDGVNKLFGAIGEGFGGGGVSVLKELPISQSAKDTLTPLVHDASALVGQLLTGKLGHEGYTRLVDHAKTISSTIAEHAPTEEAAPETVPQTVPESEAAPVKPVPSEGQYLYHGTSETILDAISKDGLKPMGRGQLSLSKTEEYARSYAENSRFPAKKGNGVVFRVKSDALDGKTTSPAKTSPESDQRYEVLTKNTVPPEAIDVFKDGKWQALAPSIPKAPEVPTGPKSSIGKSIEAKAIEAGLTKGYGDTAHYDPITIKDQSEKAAALFSNVDNARAVIRGDAPLPDGLRGTAVITAAEEYLKTNPDSDLAHELANSHLVSATSAHAQELRLAAERVPDSITAKFQEIKAAREAAVESRGGLQKASNKITADIRNEIKRTASKRPAWEDFIKEVQCGY